MLKLPSSYNYVGVFLTFSCSLGCDYCINKQGDFKPRGKISGDLWIDGLSQIETREDLPMTLCGGEPTEHPDFYKIVNGLFKAGKHLDLLTNGEFNARQFTKNISPKVFKREAPYASIRFSLHKNTNDETLVHRVFYLQGEGYSVGIWGLTHPDMAERNKKVMLACKRLKIDYREKEFLDATHGTYKYPKHMTGEINECLCKPSELLISPDGSIFRCHRDLYSDNGSYGHITHDIKPMEGFHKCYKSRCNNCDVKIKTNRLQEGGHCSVEIR